jgi:carbon-monoxide dehydrogenase large subunit
MAAHILEVADDDCELRDGRVGVRGSPRASVPLGEVARSLAPGELLPAEIDSYGLEATEYFHPEANVFSYGTHVATVEVDPLSWHVVVLKLAVVGDCGTIINPQLVDGQYCGGAAMGIGGALHEEIIYGVDGQPRTATFMDYLLPLATDAPKMIIEHMVSPASHNPDGFKGVGEGGAIGAPAAVANAITDALTPFGIEVTESPITPDRLHSLVAQACARPSSKPAEGAGHD